MCLWVWPVGVNNLSTLISLPLNNLILNGECAPELYRGSRLIFSQKSLAKARIVKLCGAENGVFVLAVGDRDGGGRTRHKGGGLTSDPPALLVSAISELTS